MISAKRIGELIAQPNLVEKDEIEGIEQAVAKYQYAASLRFLLLKAKTKFHSADLEKSLESAANFVADREYLYQFLHEAEEVQPEKEEVESIEKEIEVIPDPVIEEVKIEVKTEPIIEEVVEVEETIEIEEKQEAEEIEIAVALDKVEKEPVVELEEKEEVSDKIEVIVEPEKEVVEKPTIKIEKPAIDPNKLSFIEWLKLQKEGGHTFEKETEKPVKEVTEKVSNEVESSPKKLSKTAINSLLDKFIEAEPSISKINKENYNPVKTAKQSLEEQESLVTETLAKIHLLQKNYSKAIETYRRLILVYPEKKTYFATQIEKIRGYKSDKED